MRPITLLALLVLFASLGLARPTSIGEDLGAVPDPVREDLMHGRWDDALAKLEVLGQEKPEGHDLWLLLAGVAHDRAGRGEEALAALRQLEREHPDSPWVPKARFRQAEIHRARGEYAPAEKIYEAAVRHLRSPERQGELAAIYMEYADEASTRPDVPTPGHRLDYNRAFQLYAKVLELEAPRDVRDRALYRMATCMQLASNHEAARQGFEAYLNELDPARQKPLSPSFVAGTRIWEVRLNLGRAELATGRGAQARRTFEDLADDLSDAISAGDAPADLKPMVGDARYDLARTYGGGGDGSLLAIAAYGRYLDGFPRHPKSTVAAFAIAELQRGLGRLDQAAAAYRAVVDRAAPLGEDLDVLAEHERLAARALYIEGYSRQADGRYDDAIALYESYARRHPNGPDWAAAQQGIIETRYQIGVDHRAKERFAQARAAWLAFLTAHPLDHRAAAIQLDLGQMKLEQAMALRREDKGADVEAPLREAIDQWSRVTSKYPGSEQASGALFQTAFLQETELGELEAAIETYRLCNFGSWAGQAQARLTRMVEPSLDLVTTRSWRTNEPAKVKLNLRNVQEVQVEIYALDLEAYFRKHLTHRHVEDLDLDLIAPDRRREVSIDNYAKYAPLEQEVDLEFEGAGVWAVAVTAGELRATTLVIRSDVDVIVKSSRREVFVFAQDVKDGGPAEGVSVLIALPGDGDEPVLKELSTDADGVARLRFEELEQAEELRVLAVRDGSYASDGLTLAGLSIAQGLTPRGHLSTDRSAYRPGDSVRWRAIVRAVKDGAYHFTPGSRIDVVIRDSQGRPLHQDTLSLSDFGTVSGELSLPDQTPLGQYVVQLSGPDLPTVAGTFEVQQYELQKIELTLTAAQEVVYRGEQVVVTARAAYYYGEPVVDSPLSYQLPDGRVLEARTDAKGEVEIAFDTRDFLREGGLYVGATLREEGVTASTQVWLATHGFRLALSTPHQVVLAGDSFPVSVHTESPAGEDLARELTVQVLRRESAPGGQWRDVVVDTRTVTTSEEDGRAHLTFAVVEGGSHHLRASGSDRFGNPVETDIPLFVSGDDDAVKLRLLADSSRTKVGEQLTFELVNRAGPGLALITFEGETILGYRLVQLAAGRNELTLAIGHEHFPNVAVAAAMMNGQDLLQAMSEFDVARELLVQVTPKQGTIQPGAKAQVELTVTDQLGNPVSAELSLAVVDASLFDLYPDATPGLRSFFEQGARRQAGLRTTSSCTFSYQGVTTRIDQAVLDEQSRVQAQAQWADEQLELHDKLAALGYAGGGGGGGPSTPGPAGPAAPASRAFGLSSLQEMEANRPNDSDDFFLGRGERDGSASSREDRRRGRARKKSNKESNGWSAAATPEFDADTAFWTPAVTTDDAGRASLEFELPDKATRWRLTARGTSAQTLVGEARADLITRAEFFVELLAPLTLVEGDQPRLAARVHNLTGETGSAKLTLIVRSGEQRRFATATVELGQAPVVEHRFEALPAVEAADISLKLSVEATLDGDVLLAETSEAIPVQPWGLELHDGKSVRVTDAGALWLELPTGRSYGDRRVELFVGSSVDRVLIEEALGRTLYPSASLGGTSHAALASELVGVCAVMQSMGASGQGAQPEHAQLRRRAQGLLASLAAAQNSDGGWTWLARGGSSPEASARVVLGLTAARDAGLAPPENTLASAANYLRAAHGAAPSQALELKAALVHARAALGQGDFSAANALHRERNRLSPAGLAHTTLALVHMERAPMAADVARLLEAELVLAPGSQQAACRVRGNRPWSRSTLDMTALAVIALERGLPGSTRVRAGVEYLLAHRPWSSRRGRGLAVAAVARFQRETELQDERATLTVSIGEVSHEFLLERGGAGQRLLLPLEGDGRRVQLRYSLEGKARPHLAAVLTGFSSDVSSPNTDPGFRVTSMTYSAEPRRYRGRALPVGFGVLRNRRTTWTNRVEHLPLGRTTLVSLYVYRDSLEEAAQGDYLVLEVPLPAGTRVLEDSVIGGIGTFEQRDGRLILPLGQSNGSHSVRFTLLGVDPGEYRQPPAVVRSAYDPGRIAVGAVDELTVLARGEASPDEYRPTPDELFHHGQRLFEDGDLEGAHGKLGGLYAAHEGNLRTSDLRTLSRIMLTVSLARRDPAAAVRFFEVLREKDPSYVVPFDQIVAIGEAYRDLKEFERAYLIFRATALETFGKDLEVAGTLKDQGERAGALDALDELTLAYPDLPAVVEARLALADQLLTLAPNAHRDASLVKADYDRAALTGRGVLMLKRFLALNPDSRLAPDAGLSLVSAYLGLEDPSTAASLAGEMAELYTEPRFADAFGFTRAVAQWHLGQEDEATGLLQRIADAEYTDERGKKSPSENRDLALYILGQIAHAKQDAATAEEYYDQVAHLFADASEALAGFRQRSLSLEEITSARPGEAVSIDLEFQNLEQAELLVYAVDLMTLYLREKDLSQVTAVNLAGIAPTLTTSVTLGEGRDLRSRDATAELSLTKPGAYLVIARSGGLHASGLVLVSDLELEVAEDRVSGRVRVQAMDRGDGRYLRDVDVRVVGSASGAFVHGETDPRGLFVADGVSGTATVVARLGDDHYAFHRGEQPLDVAPSAGLRFAAPLQTGAYYKNVLDLNTRQQNERFERLEQEIRKVRRGVQLQQIR